MSNVVITDPINYTNIANSIRAKNGLTRDYKPSEMSAAIDALNVSGVITLQDKTVTPSTSDQEITKDTGYDGLGVVTVYAMPSGTAGTPTATKGTVSNHSISVTPSVTNTTGYITGSTKTGTAVTVSASELVSGTKEITSNGTNIDVTNYAKVDVSVSGGTSTIESLTVTPTESEQTFNSSSVDGYKPVTVSAISSTYVGSGITQRSSTDLEASGATVTVPAGYYSSQASKAVSSGSATGPSSLSASSATVSTGTNTITLTKTGVTTTPTVSAGYVSSATSSTATVALTASVTTKAATTYTPGTTNQTIASGTYLTGTQTISGDADLIADNIKKNVNIFGVTGTYEGEPSTEVIADNVSTLPSGGEHHNIIGVDISQDTVTARTLVKDYTAHDAEGNAITGIFEGGEIEYEEGTINLPTTTSNYDITFSNTHTSLPTFYMISRASNAVYVNTFISTVFSLTENIGVPQDENYGVSYGTVDILSIGSSSYSTSSVIRLTKPSSNLSESDTSYPRYWATETRIRIPASASKPISGPYKWLAVWKNFNNTGE